MNKLVAAVLTTGALFAATGAQAQRWSGGDDRYNIADGVCSGQRARYLQNRIHRELHEGDVDRYGADRMDRTIDQLDYRSRQECEEGDHRSIWKIAQRYDHIERWLQRHDHTGWRRRW